MFGVGGVGGHVVEALVAAAWAGVDVVDGDRVDETNLNRQIIALESTVGELKTDAVKRRALDINPGIIMNTYNMFYLPENADEIDLSGYDYVVDAVDTVTAKPRNRGALQRPRRYAYFVHGDGQSARPYAV